MNPSHNRTRSMSHAATLLWQRAATEVRRWFPLERESYVTLIFFVAHLWINTNRFYIVLLGVTAALLYLINRHATKTLWILLLASFPFQQGKYFLSFLQSFTHPDVITRVIYPATFTDALLLSLVYLTIRNRRMFTAGGSLIDVLVILLMIAGGVSTYFANYFSVALFGFWQLCRLLLLYFVSRAVFSRYGWMKITLETFLLFGLFNALLIIVQHLNGGPVGFAAERLNPWSSLGRYAVESATLYRPGGITDDPNASATTLGMLLPIAALLGATGSFLRGSIPWAVLLASSAAMVFTGSRTVIVSTAAVCAVSLFLIGRHRALHLPLLIRRYLPVIMSVGVLLVGSFLYFRLLSLNEAFTQYGSGTYRIRHMEIGIRTLLTNPLGTGLNTSAYEMANAYEPDYYMYDPSELHSIFAQSAAGMGAPGLILVVALSVAILVRLAKMSVKPHNMVLPFAILVALTNYVAAANFYPWLLDMSVSGFFWVLLAYIV